MDPVISSSDILVSSLDTLANSISCASSSIMEDTAINSLILTSTGVASSLGIPQGGLGLHVIDGQEPVSSVMGIEEGSFDDDLDGEPIPADSSDLTTLQSNFMLVNLPNSTQTPITTATLMPILMLGSGMQKAGAGIDTSTELMLDRNHQDWRQLLRLRDLAHANLICATQESIAKSFGMNKQSIDKYFKCEECGRYFKSSSHYRYHCETHKGNKVLQCRVEGCNRRFAWPAHLKYHTKTHVNDRRYSCTMDDCKKTFYTVQSLDVHMRTHTGHKPFICPEEDCVKSFTTAGNLKNHLRIHTGERPYICDHVGCIQTFAEHSSLRKHKLIHTGEKPYECEICNKVFSQSGSRNTHKRRHHRILKKSCAVGEIKDLEPNLHEARDLMAEQRVGPNQIVLVDATCTEINLSSPSAITDHDGISLAHSMLGGVTLGVDQGHHPSSDPIMHTGQHANMTMLSDGRIVNQESMTLSHSILEVHADLQPENGKLDATVQCAGPSDSIVVVLSQSNDNHSLSSMIPDASQYTVSHQQTTAEDMVYDTAMLPTSGNLSDHDGHGVDMRNIEVNHDIVITW